MMPLRNKYFGRIDFVFGNVATAVSDDHIRAIARLSALGIAFVMALGCALPITDPV